MHTHTNQHYTHIQTHTHTCITHSHISICTQTYTHTYVIYMHTHIHNYSLSHTHTHRPSPPHRNGLILEMTTKCHYPEWSAAIEDAPVMCSLCSVFIFLFVTASHTNKVHFLSTWSLSLYYSCILQVTLPGCLLILYVDSLVLLSLYVWTLLKYLHAVNTDLTVLSDFNAQSCMFLYIYYAGGNLEMKLF